MKTVIHPLRFGLLCCLGATGALHAQSTESADADDVVTLQPFTVCALDVEGYRATRTISASRLNVPLAEVPVNVPVITGQFITDAASNVQREALEWHSAVEGKAVRGFDTAEFYRHGFQHLSDTQGFLIQRMEIVRGPTAVLNGPIQPGGGINVITKQAVLDSTFGETRAQYTAGEGRSHESYGIDLNAGELGPRAEWGSTVGARVVASYQHDSGRAIGVGTDYASILTNVRLRPARDTIITLEYYYYDLESDRTDHHLAVNDAASRAVPSLSGRVPLYVSYDLPYWASWNGPDGTTPETLNELYLNLNQKIVEGVYLDISYNRHDRDLSFLNTASHGNPAGGFALVQKPTSTGDIYNANNYWLRRGLREAYIGNVTDQYSVLLTFAPRINGDRKHRFMFGHQTFEQDRRLLFADAFQVANPTQRYYQYFDPANYANETPASLGVGFGDFFYNYNNPALDRIESNEQSTTFVTWNGKWLDDRLITLAGAFHTNMDQRQSNGGGPLRRLADGKDWLPQLGFVYSINDDYGVYGVYTRSSAINANQAPPQNDPNFFFPPKSGEMAEIGLRFDLFDEKVIGSLGFYQINQIDLVSIDPATGNAIPLGDVESKGLDLDLFYYPAENWSVIFSYSNNEKDVPTGLGGTAADGDVFRSPRNKWSTWTKYSFTSGVLDGVSIGGGFRWTEGTPFSINGVSGINPDKTRADLFIQKTGDLTEKVSYTAALNVRNLTGKANLSNAVVIGSQTYAGAIPGSNQRYEFGTDPELMFTFGLKF